MVQVILIGFLLALGFIGNEYNMGWAEMMAVCIGAQLLYDKLIKKGA